LPEGGRLIRLSVKDIGNMLFIRVENAYDGPDIAGEALETSKADKQYHGFGIKSMRRIVEKYGGEMDVNTANGLYCLTCMFTV
ncbi:MAG: ATP-binding protein, partial [Oscillospiraceae bacterium]|nr:ATP-binding protein [Oscillospiraceae bacterium]